MTDEKELKDQRIPIMMTLSEVEAIDDWMFKNRIRSRGEAIRRLCQMGIIFDRELTPAVELVVNHLRDTIAGNKPKLTPAQHQQMFQDMAISLFNAGTVFTKLDNDIPTEEAIQAVIDLYEYYKKAEKN
ncbi:hypothetical protein M8994_07080 [Brucella sp. 21LCYQ03]|nr:hypothetical protein [Brucella sp. 21LCYQ03]